MSAWTLLTYLIEAAIFALGFYCGCLLIGPRRHDFPSLHSTTGHGGLRKRT